VSPPLLLIRRVLILGSPGSGKSTLAKRLSERTGLPVVHLDQVFWSHGWVSLPKEAFEQRCREIITGDRWIIDGNFSSTLALRAAAADTLIFLDVGRFTCLYRAIRRILTHRGRVRPDMAPGCPERFDGEFLRYIWTFPHRSRPGVLRALAGIRSDQQAITLRTLGDVQDFLDSLPPPPRSSTGSPDSAPSTATPASRG
jgi:adenylate kinase family enzyme